MLHSTTHEPLGLDACRLLAGALGERPTNALAIHGLRAGACRAYVLGKPASPRAALVEVEILPGEPQGFAADPADLWQLLRDVEGWDCVEVAPELADGLGRLIVHETGRTVRFYDDVGFLLERPVASFAHPAVRLLGVGDRALLEAAPEELRSGRPPDLGELLATGVVAGAIVDGRLVSRAYTQSLTGRYADVAVHTLEAWRKRGFATAAASLVARRVQEAGCIPVWSAGEDNHASLRVAQKLGFVEAYRLVYVIPLGG